MNKRQAKKKRKYQKFIEEYLKVSEKIQRAMLKKRPYTTGLEVDAIIIDDWIKGNKKRG